MAKILGNAIKAGTMPEAQYLKVGLYGHPGTGKTTCAATAPGPVLVITRELNALAVIAKANPEAAVLLVSTVQEVRDVLDDLQAYPVLDFPFGTVVLDGLLEIQNAIKGEMQARTPGKTEFTFADWGMLGDKTMAVVTGFRALPCHLIVTMLAEESGDEGARTVGPALLGRASREVPSLLNAVGYTFKEPDPARPGRIRYSVLMESSSRFVCKTLPGLLPKMPGSLGLWAACVFPQHYQHPQQPDVAALIQKQGGAGEWVLDAENAASKAHSTGGGPEVAAPPVPGAQATTQAPAPQVPDVPAASVPQVPQEAAAQPQAAQAGKGKAKPANGKPLPPPPMAAPAVPVAE